ncbi:MAG: hypothetical protein PHQ62_00610 [Clostridia bacterium]|nr:hypothetical protein [Clostridia bacterium]
MKKTYYFTSILILLIIVALVISPVIYVQAFSNGVLVWASVLLPTIFPFLFFTKILTDLGVLNSIAKNFSFTKKIFKTPPISAYAFMISIMSGYPVGAKIVSDLFSSNLISKQDAFKICTFTSNSGPMFIYGSVGIGMLFSRTLGLVLLFSHIIGAILNGILYRNHKEVDIKIENIDKNFSQKKISLGESMWDSVVSILVIGGFVCIFFVVIEIFNNLCLFQPIAMFLGQITNIDSNVFLSVMNGIWEITHGCLDVCYVVENTFASTLLCCGIITFGGVATMLQAFAFLQKIGMRMGFFLKQKITHTLFSVCVCAILLLIFT